MGDTRTKKKPTHDLGEIQAAFDTVEKLVITGTAQRSAFRLGYSLEDVVDAVQDLRKEDFVLSKPAHSPPVPGVWHDSYKMRWDGKLLFIKFAGKAIVDIALTSFKEDLP